MYLNYSAIESRCDEPPVLRLQCLSGKELGAIPFAHNINFEILHSEVSTIEFDVPYMADGIVNPVYGELKSYRCVYTENLGIYVLASPTISGDGISEIKSCRGYSLEQTFDTKRLYLQEGTYDFWNPAHPDNTILGRIIELDPRWTVGYVDPALIGKYRTFDEYNDSALGFCYGTAMEKYNCIVVFDVYAKTINAYSTTSDRGTLPIYLSYENLVEDVKVEELTDEMSTKLYPYGADDLDIRAVNPTGADYIVDLSYFLSIGDLDITTSTGEMLSDRVKDWQKRINLIRYYYEGRASYRASLTAQKLAEEAALVDIQGEVDAETAKQSAALYAISLETPGSTGYQTQSDKLAEIKANLEALSDKLAAKQAQVDALQEEIEYYTGILADINNTFAYNKFFTEEERLILNDYLIDGDITNDTFVASDLDTTASGVSKTMSGLVKFAGGKVVGDGYAEETGMDMYLISGGTISIVDSEFTADVIRGTLEVDVEVSEGGTYRYVFSSQLGTIKYGNSSFDRGMLTMSGQAVSCIADSETDPVTGGDVFTGPIALTINESQTFFTVNVNEFEKYSTSMELYEYGMDVMNECAWPTMEFSLSSANFLFQQEFAPFKDALELGKGVHLGLGSEGVITANIIGIKLDFDKPESVDFTFSNRYQRRNGVKALSDMIKGASRSGKTYDANKFIYNHSTDKVSEVSNILDGNFSAAKNKVLCNDEVSVNIQGSGIHVGNGDEQLRIINSMIAMTSDGWNTVSTAIGKFTTNLGTHWGVNAQLLGGELIIGEKMVLQSETAMFKFDATGAWLYNSRIVLQGDNGQILVHPSYGIAAGNANLYTADGTEVTPSFIDENGDIILDDGMPINANFYLDLNTGEAYLRGTVNATAGNIGGWALGDDFLYGGSGSSYIALNGSGTNDNAAYAIWAGAENPASAPFRVTKAGNLYAENGTFGGTLYAAKVSGALKAADGDSWLEGCGIRVGENADSSTGYNFYVDPFGNVSIMGDLTLASGVITWDNLGSGVTSSINGAYSAADSAEAIAKSIANGTYVAQNPEQTFIDGTKISAPYIEGGVISGSDFYGNTFNIHCDDYKEGSINLYGKYGKNVYHFLKIGYYEADYPNVIFGSPDGGTITLGSYSGNVVVGSSSFDLGGVDVYAMSTTFSFSEKSRLDLNGATITGLNVVFG